MRQPSVHRMLCALLAVTFAICQAAIYETVSSHNTFIVNSAAKTFKLNRNNLTDDIDMGLTLPPDVVGQKCEEGDVCVDYGGLARLVVTTNGHCHTVEWTVTDGEALGELRDCVLLRGHWYGGGEAYDHRWPIEQQPRPETAYVTADVPQKPNQWYLGVSEPYWLSSTGFAIVADDTTPLFVSLPDDDSDGTADELCLAARHDPPFLGRENSSLVLRYSACSGDDVRKVHEATLPKFYSPPTGVPDERMLKEPIWCTWAEYHEDVSADKVMSLASDIVERGYPYSQIEIDDNWEECYGAAVFNATRFPDVRAMVDTLHNQQFRVTLWVHPFINTNCHAFDYPDQQGYFVKDADGKTQLTEWWQSNSAAILDFTNSEAVAWWTQRLRSLQDQTGIDAFKFDAGETNWLPTNYTLNIDVSLWPNGYTNRYVEEVSRFGELIEVRAAKNTQDKPILVRMLDKNSNWGFQNGLKTLVPTLLHFGIQGYPFVLPDMIGGNAYYGQPSAELFTRWAQANALMPVLQYSLLPWRFGDQANKVTLEMARLHLQHSPLILQAATEATKSMAPINRPTWWLCPTHEACLTADQQFLVGDDMLVAPITEEGSTSKTVVLPPGDWRSSRDGLVYTGLQIRTFTDISLDTLLYFTRVLPSTELPA